MWFTPQLTRSGLHHLPPFLHLEHCLTFGRSNRAKNVGPLTLSSDMGELLAVWRAKAMGPGVSGGPELP